MQAYRKIIFYFILCLYFPSKTLYADITVGTLLFYPPFVFNSEQGFDIELIENVCLRLEEKCTIKAMPTHELFAALDNKKIDIAIGGLSITPERQKNYIFSLPYLINEGVFLVLNESGLKNINDLAGKQLGVLVGDVTGSAYYDYLQINFKDKFHLLLYDDAVKFINDFSNHVFVGAFVREATAHYWAQNSVGTLKILGQPVIFGDGVGIMALPEKKELMQKINQALVSLEKDGFYLQLYKIYFTFES